MFHWQVAALTCVRTSRKSAHQAFICLAFPSVSRVIKGILLEFLDYVFGQGGPDCGDYLKKGARGNAVVFPNHVFPLECMLGDLLEKVLVCLPA